MSSFWLRKRKGLRENMNSTMFDLEGRQEQQPSATDKSLLDINSERECKIEN